MKYNRNSLEVAENNKWRGAPGVRYVLYTCDNERPKKDFGGKKIEKQK